MNDFARDDELKTRGNRVGPWSRVITSALGHLSCAKRAHARRRALSRLIAAIFPSVADGHEGLVPRSRSLRASEAGLQTSETRLFQRRHHGSDDNIGLIVG